MALRVQLDLPFLRTPPAPSRPPLVAADPAVEFVRMRRARRYVLRVRPDGSIRVTVPRGGSRAEAVLFLQRHARWVEQERARVREVHGAREWLDGTTIMLRGEPVLLTVGQAAGGRCLRYGTREIRLPAGTGDLRPAVEADRRNLAREELGPRLMEIAAAHGLRVDGVSIRNQRSRWGSCSRGGRIALNFRLVQMPAAVRDYILIHELMHLRQQNHSRKFWRLVEAACPAFRDAERWLKTEGRALF